ncbi:hypothetical protein [Actomonas aquatica]|uniref:Restriction endonuclease n=1 Tax=Actomonas aquatica TaxID=2866162 RepID=A0ABZ1CA89_9BACT|nr:hypothetical protein [Opitutus sp. WL0086]WRQ88603.1 hypothetical protein K1X11_004250 [Opitutus sp. WL0086]
MSSVGNLLAAIAALETLTHAQKTALLNVVRKLARCALCDHTGIDWSIALSVSMGTLHRTKLEFVGRPQSAAARANFPRKNELAAFRRWYREDVDSDFFRANDCVLPSGFLRLATSANSGKFHSPGHPSVKPYPAPPTEHIELVFELIAMCLANRKPDSHWLILSDFFGGKVIRGKGVTLKGHETRLLKVTRQRKAAHEANELIGFLAEDHFRTRNLLKDFGRAFRFTLATRAGQDYSVCANEADMQPSSFLAKFQDVNFRDEELEEYLRLEALL